MNSFGRERSNENTRIFMNESVALFQKTIRKKINNVKTMIWRYGGQVPFHKIAVNSFGFRENGFDGRMEVGTYSYCSFRFPYYLPRFPVVFPIQRVHVVVGMLKFKITQECWNLKLQSKTLKFNTEATRRDENCEFSRARLMVERNG